MPKVPVKTDVKKMACDPRGWFELAKKELLNNPNNFLKEMIGYDKDNMCDNMITRVEPMLEREEISEDKVNSTSAALSTILLWIKAMVTYQKVLRIVNPKIYIAHQMTLKLEVFMKNVN